MVDSVAKRRGDAIVAWLQRTGGGRGKEMAAAFGWSKNTFLRALRLLLADGVVIARGDVDAVRYVLADAVAPPMPLPEVVRATEAARSLIMQRILQAGPTTEAQLIALLPSLTPATITAVLSQACAAGHLQRKGNGARAYYVLVLPREATVRVVPARGAKGKPVRIPPAELVTRVVAYVAEHPGSRFGLMRDAFRVTERPLGIALKTARDTGLIWLEGVRHEARYFPTATAPTAPTAPAEHATPLPPRTQEAERDSGDERHWSVRLDALVHELDGALRGEMESTRLADVLQAIIAELRIAQRQLRADHPSHRRIEFCLRRITAVRSERRLRYLVGLNRDASEDWTALASKARKRVAAWDEDAHGGRPVDTTARDL